METFPPLEAEGNHITTQWCSKCAKYLWSQTQADGLDGSALWKAMWLAWLQVKPLLLWTPPRDRDEVASLRIQGQPHVWSVTTQQKWTGQNGCHKLLVKEWSDLVIYRIGCWIPGKLLHGYAKSLVYHVSWPDSYHRWLTLNSVSQCGQPCKMKQPSVKGHGWLQKVS